MSQVAANLQARGLTEPGSQEELRIFRNLMRSLTQNASKTLKELELWCNDAEQLEHCSLLRHYLDYMQRLCDGAV
jgi:hypothetical protein